MGETNSKLSAYAITVAEVPKDHISYMFSQKVSEYGQSNLQAG